MKKLFIIFCTFLSMRGFSQNLVPNSSFENYVSCPTGASELSLAVPWTMPTNTIGASSDLFNSCNSNTVGVPNNAAGYQNAHTGVGYAGIYTYYSNNVREYLQVQLLNPLAAGNTYHVEFYVSPSENAGIALDAIGVYISANAISGSGNPYTLPYTPQIINPANNIISDTSSWTVISGDYMASGGEEYLTIGNFLNDSITNMLVFNSSGWMLSYYFVDDVSVTLNELTSILQPENDFKIVYSETNDLKIQNVKSNIEEINIYGAVGQKVFGQYCIPYSHTINVNMSNFLSGIYFVEVRDEKNNRIVKKIVKI